MLCQAHVFLQFLYTHLSYFWYALVYNYCYAKLHDDEMITCGDSLIQAIDDHY